MKSFIFFQQQYVHFFSLFSLFHLEICQQQNIVPVESHAGSQKKKNVPTEQGWISPTSQPALSPLKAGWSRPSLSLWGPPYPTPNQQN